ncbi:hypothetical protein NP233_g1617 [Leucocoprinus birnbaumii]|uniref:Pheromone receptor n=1 Tax=Leucocoprinus birnbaumii TaxID=56174 RepID=A0AAD5YXU6_9AGAR|nr:hypothetical protein NP233_g1617 [Leucocoprinus birnbaumii]
MAASNQVFSAFSFLSFILTTIPFAWHLQAWNTGTCIFMGWVSISTLLLFINSVVWNDNAINWVPVYCDIATKFLVGASVGIPAAFLCINRRLYHIVSVRSVTRTVSEKRRGVLIDLSIGVGIPVIVMILHVIVQGHRFDIFEDVGCWPTTYNTPLAYALVLAPPLGLAVIASAYSVLCIVALKHNYVEFKKTLSNGLGLEAFFDIPMNLYIIIAHVRAGNIQPWISWEDTHFDFNRFEAFPSLIWRNSGLQATDLERTRWTIVACGFLFFAFFGFADEAIKNYKLAYNFFARRLGLKPAYIPGISAPPSQVTSSVGWNGGSERTLGSRLAGIEKGRGLFKTNGTEPWMSSFDAFANKVRLVVMKSPTTSALLSGRESTLHGSTTNSAGRCLTPLSATTLTRSELGEKHQEDRSDSMSTLTQFTDFTGDSIPRFTVAGADGETRPVSTLRRRSSYFEGGDPDDKRQGDNDTRSEFGHSEAHSNVTADSYSEYSQPSPSFPPPLITPLPPPVPPKDSIYASPLVTAASLPPSLIVPQPAPLSPVSPHWRNPVNLVTVSSPIESLASSQQRRTPPRQAVPVSVSASPTPNGSFLDLRASVISEDFSPNRDAYSADNRV